MPTWCAVPGCNNENANFKFPKDKELKRKWEIAIRRGDPNQKGKLWVAGTHHRVCQLHFIETDFLCPDEKTKRGESIEYLIIS